MRASRARSLGENTITYPKEVHIINIYMRKWETQLYITLIIIACFQKWEIIYRNILILGNKWGGLRKPMFLLALGIKAVALKAASAAPTTETAPAGCGGRDRFRAAKLPLGHTAKPSTGTNCPTCPTENGPVSHPEWDSLKPVMARGTDDLSVGVPVVPLKKKGRGRARGQGGQIMRSWHASS